MYVQEITLYYVILFYSILLFALQPSECKNVLHMEKVSECKNLLHMEKVSECKNVLVALLEQVVELVLRLAVVDEPLLQLLPLAVQPLDLGLQTVHIADERPVLI